MRWQELAAELAAQWEGEQVAETEDEIADRLRSERARIRLIDRLAAASASGQEVGVRLAGEWVRGKVSDVGPDWCLLAGAAGVEVLVALDSVTQVTGLSDRARDPVGESAVAARFGVAAVLRRLVDRGELGVTLADGSRIRGALTAVGADAFDVQRGSDPEVVSCLIGQLASVSWRP